MTAPTPDFAREREGKEREKGIRGVSVDPIENDSVQSQYLLVKFSEVTVEKIWIVVRLKE